MGAPPRVVVGLDGGSTKTHCVVVEVRPRDGSEGDIHATAAQGPPARVLGAYTSGSCNHNSVGERSAKRNVLRAMAGALREASGNGTLSEHVDVIGMCLCMSGTDRRRDKEMVAGWLKDAHALEPRDVDSPVPYHTRKCCVPGDAPSSLANDLDEMRDDRTLGYSWQAMMRKRFRFSVEDAGPSGEAAGGDGEEGCVDIMIENDALGALSSGTRGERDGVVLIAGTGTIAYAFYVDELQQRRSARVSGWGAMFGDGGCGYDIGQKGLSTVARMLDGRLDNRGSLPSAILGAVDAETPEELLSWAYTEVQGDNCDFRPGRWDRVASLARVVIECAESGDADAIRLIDEAALELSGSVDTVVRKTMHTATNNDPSISSASTGSWSGKVVLVGGVLTGKTADGRPNILMRKLNERFTKILPHAQIIKPIAEPAVGAAWLIETEVTASVCVSRS